MQAQCQGVPLALFCPAAQPGFVVIWVANTVAEHGSKRAVLTSL